MGSSRLPGKVLLPLGDETVLGRVVRAVRASGVVDDVVVATTAENVDDAVVAFCDEIGVAVTRGPVEDVLTRFLQTLQQHPADAVVRVTADCPLLDPGLVRIAATTFRANADLDYLSTALVRSLPRGLDVEVVSAAALQTAGAAARDHHRAHVTSYLYSHPEQFRLLGLTFAPPAPDVRVTLDTQADYELLAAVVDGIGPELVAWDALVGWLRERPEVLALNAHIEQKALAEG